MWSRNYGFRLKLIVLKGFFFWGGGGWGGTAAVSHQAVVSFAAVFILSRNAPDDEVMLGGF